MKVMNVVFGIGIAIILFIVVMLGTQVFYKEPTPDSSGFNCTYMDKPIYSLTTESCAEDITVKQCREQINKTNIFNEENQRRQEECWKRYEEAQKEYGKILFVINNIVGIIFVIISLYLFSMINIAAGTAFAGLALIIYGFMRGWQGTGDILKFFVALIVATLFIIFAIVINKRYQKKNKK